MRKGREKARNRKKGKRKIGEDNKGGGVKEEVN